MVEEPDEDTGDDGLAVTAKYVYREFRKHERICAQRWWLLLTSVMGVELTIIAAFAALYLQRHP